MVPLEELERGGAQVAVIELAQQGGGGKAGGAEVVDEVDEGVKLALGEGRADVAGNGLRGGVSFAGQQAGGFILGDAHGKGFAGKELVAVADGAEAGGVKVGGGTEAFVLHDEFESGFAEAHDYLLWRAGTKGTRDQGTKTARASSRRFDGR